MNIFNKPCLCQCTDYGVDDTFVRSRTNSSTSRGDPVIVIKT